MSTADLTYQTYQQRIAAVVPGAEPRHVEAWMRIEFGTLDHLGGAKFDAEVRIAAECARAAGPADSEALAASYGL